MTTTDNELAAVIGDPGPPRVGFRQGTVVEFNQFTRSNVIDVGGTLLEDVPYLNVTDAVGTVPGNVVGLLTFQSSWWILGRISVPGTPGGLVVAVDFFSGFDHGGPFAIDTSKTIEASITVDVPSWANESAVMVMGMFSAQNQSGSTDDYNGWTRIDGIEGQGFNLGATVGETVFITVGQAEVINVAGKDTFDIDAQVWTTSNSWPVDNTNNASIAAMVLHRSAS